MQRSLVALANSISCPRHLFLLHIPLCSAVVVDHSSTLLTIETGQLVGVLPGTRRPGMIRFLCALPKASPDEAMDDSDQKSNLKFQSQLQPHPYCPQRFAKSCSSRGSGIQTRPGSAGNTPTNFPGLDTLPVLSFTTDAQPYRWNTWASAKLDLPRAPCHTLFEMTCLLAGLHAAVG